MSSQSLFQVPYLRTTRAFPPQIEQLSIELSKSYIDIANSVNLRTVGLFATKYAATTGENWWFEKNRKQQGIRQVFTFTTFANIPHNLDFKDISRFTRNYGEYTDGTNWYGLISGTSVLIPGQVVFYVTPTDIVFVVDGSEPSIAPDGEGILVLEWLSNV